MKLHPNTLAGLGLILTTFSIIYYRSNPLFFIILLCSALLLDVWAKHLRITRHNDDPAMKLADWTSDRLSEGVLFAVAWMPWLFLFVLNCFLTLYSFLRKETITLPLRQLFLVYYVFMLIKP